MMSLLGAIQSLLLTRQPVLKGMPPGSSKGGFPVPAKGGASGLESAGTVGGA